MKKNLDNFDDLVKNKLDGMDFSFNEANWEKASEMIDAARPAKRSNLLVASCVILAGALIVGSVYYFTSVSKDADQKLAHNHSSVHGQVSSSNVNSQSFSNSSAQKITAISTNNSSENLIPAEQKNNIQTNSGNSSSSDVSEKTEQLTSATINKETTTTVVKNHSENNSSNTSLTSKGNTKKSATLTHKTAGANLNKTKTASQASLNVPSDATTPIGDIEHDGPKTKDAEAEVATGDQTKEAEKELTSATPSVAIGQPDTSSTSDFTQRKDYVKMRHHTLFAEIGAVNSFGWKANNERNGNSVSPLFGINYMYSFTSKSSVLIGVQYNSIANLTESNVSFSVTTFDFGKNNEVTTYKVTGLQYLVAPIKYIHKLDKNNAIGVGLNMTYLMNTKNKVETSKFIESNVQKTESKNDNGYGMDQLNRYNAQVAISYNRKLTKNLGFNIELNQAVKNVFKDYSYFGVSNKNSKPASIKLSLTYTIFNK